MSQNDWWAELYGADDRDDRGAESHAPAVKKPDDMATQRRALATVSPASDGTNPSVRRISVTNHWGTATEDDPFVAASSPAPASGDITPEEEAELKRHEKKPFIPPQPTEPPKAVEPDPEPVKDPEPEPKTDEEPDEEPEAKEKKSLKEKIQGAKQSVGKARSTVAEKTEPVRKVSGAAFSAVTPEKGQSWSFLWALGGAWTISPQTFVALADRVAMIFGKSEPLSGPERMDWGWLHGIGPWFGDRIAEHMEAGTIPRLVLLSLVGLGPVLIAQFAEKINNDRLRRLLGWIGYGFPAVWILGKWYFDHWGIDAMGFDTWNDMYVSAFAALTWWGFSFSRTVEPGFTQCLLRLPLAAVIIGIGLNAPGAAF